MLVEVERTWFGQILSWLTELAPEGTLLAQRQYVMALLALILVSLCCGSVGSLVVGGRLAFFSDALAHCAFAGVCLGFAAYNFLAPPGSDQSFWAWVSPVMIAFGVLVGAGIAYVRQQTELASDTVIGVAFAAAIGLYATLRVLMQRVRRINLEDFLFGNPVTVTEGELLGLLVMTVVTLAVLAWLYNGLLLASFNPSLALSRRVPVALVRALFVMLLAAVINLCLRVVGVMLINALLVVPAATALLVSVNLRQVFWRTLLISLLTSIAGLGLNWEIYAHFQVEIGTSGTIILLGVGLFCLALLVGPAYRRWAGAGRGEPAGCGSPGPGPRTASSPT